MHEDGTMKGYGVCGEGQGWRQLYWMLTELRELKEAREAGEEPMDESENGARIGGAEGSD